MTAISVVHDPITTCTQRYKSSAGLACPTDPPWIARVWVCPPWVASPAAPTPAAPAAMSPSNPWLTTEELCAQLAISRSTLFAIKRSGLLKPGRHLVPKNPGCRRSHLLCTARTE